MKTYIVKETDGLKIIQVRADQEDFFQADYAGKILVGANSTMEALLKFQDLPDKVKFPDQEASPQ
ncbi:MAG: hypothetical protein J0H74_36820 [Chitinophagaceae bacterium]|nr:hypothetical protein [Chitinophagaceae bacterium]